MPLKWLASATLVIWGGLVALAEGTQWQRLTSETKPECNQENICRIIESKGTFEVEFTTEVRQSLKSMKEFKIRDLKTGGVTKVDVSGVNSIEPDREFEVQQVKLRPDGSIDIALYAYSSAHEGKMYYYLLYDPNANKFIVPEDPLPKLSYNSSSGNYISALQLRKYALDKNTLKFSAK